MPLYHCYRGDTENIGLDKTNAVDVIDGAGRPWACVAVDDDATDQDAARTNLRQILDSLQAQGMMTYTTLSVINCQNPSELSGLLSEEKDMPRYAPQ